MDRPAAALAVRWNTGGGVQPFSRQGETRRMALIRATHPATSAVLTKCMAISAALDVSIQETQFGVFRM